MAMTDEELCLFALTLNPELFTPCRLLRRFCPWRPFPLQKNENLLELFGKLGDGNSCKGEDSDFQRSAS